jgi:hypothetical protein
MEKNIEQMVDQGPLLRSTLKDFPVVLLFFLLALASREEAERRLHYFVSSNKIIIIHCASVLLFRR